MARNPNIVKMGKQKFRKRRGNFKPFSDELLNNSVAISSSMSKFWSANVHTKGSVVRSHVPKDAVGVFEYRNHAKLNPKQAYLDALFPGVQFKSAERMLVEQQLEKLSITACAPDQHVVLQRTKHTCLYLFFNTEKSETYLVERKFSIVKVSCNYGNPHRAKSAVECGTIRWKQIRTFTLPAPNS